VRGPRAWTFLTIEGTRQYGGNDGYSDDPGKLYRYDSDVSNHRQVAAGDVAVIRSLNEVLGVAIVERVTEGKGTKERLRCPECSTVNVKRRATQEPPFRCHKGHLFESPTREWVTVRTFEAQYGATFRKIEVGLTVGQLLGAVMRPSDQMSIKEIDLAWLDAQLRANSSTAPIVESFTRRLAPLDFDEESGSEFQDSIIEERRRVLRAIAQRRGQRRFRNRLIERYGCACQISTCPYPGLVEAAHIRPYAISSDNGARNGLLLRSDLHTLFDLGLLGIDPNSLKVHLAAALTGAGYDQFEGAILQTNGTSGPSSSALRERWAFFSECLQMSETQLVA
jgi:hypothetical protein